MTDSPHTPINLITSSTPSHSIYNQLLKSPLNVDSDDEREQTTTSLKPTLDQPFPSSPSSSSSHPENIEIMISNLLIVLDDPSKTTKDINKSQIKTILQKCLITISHYKLQNEILKFETNEVNKRNNVENELIKKQVDYLLKSPFKPSDHDTPISHTPDSMPKKKKFRSSTTSSVGTSTNPSKIEKPTTGRKKLKLVEKFNNHGKNEYNNCIKVFHLEKN